MTHSQPKELALPIERLYRAHVEPHHWRGVERTAYVEAFSERAALDLIAAAIGAIESRPPDQVRERIYNITSARECIDQGESADHELRLFEIGWSADRISFVRHPLFLVDAPGPLARAWARTLFHTPLDEGAPELSDAERGMAWWNSVTAAERGEWLARANSSVPADAWKAYKANAADGALAPAVPDAHTVAAFAAVLRSLREERGLSQADLAQTAGIDIVVLQDMEDARHSPHVFELVALAEGLQVTVDELLRLVAAVEKGGEA